MSIPFKCGRFGLPNFGALPESMEITIRRAREKSATKFSSENYHKLQIEDFRNRTSNDPKGRKLFNEVQ